MMRSPGSEYRIYVPLEDRTHIAPDIRIKAFKEICETYPKLDKRLELLYAYLNSDPEVLFDYLIVFKTKSDLGAPLILYDCVPMSSDRATPAYLYYVKTNNMKNFYKFGLNDMAKLAESDFAGFINTQGELSSYKKSPLYWRNPKNYAKLLRGLSDLQLQYMSRGGRS